MKSFFINLKISIKSLVKTTPTNLLFFIGLPIFLTFVMGFVNDESENPIVITADPVIITDNDNSTASQDLVDFLSSEQIQKFITVTDNKEDAYIEIIIPNDYEETILNNSKTNIEIKELKDSSSLVLSTKEVLNNFIDKYKASDLASILSTPAISTEFVDPIIAENSYAANAAKMIGFLISMLVMSLTASSYVSEDLGLNKRIYASPKSNSRLYLENFVVSFSQGLFLLLGYVLFFRLLNISFTGNLGLLLIISIISAFTITSFSSIISAFCNKKYGNFIVTALFFLHIAIGDVFISFGNLARLSPFTSIQQMYNQFVYTGEFTFIQSDLLITLAIGTILFIIALIKEAKFRREL